MTLFGAVVLRFRVLKGVKSGEGEAPPQEICSYFVWKWTWYIFCMFLVRNACISKMLSSQTEQLSTLMPCTPASRL